MKEAIDSVAGSRGQGQGLGSPRASQWDSRMTLGESVASSPVYRVLWRVQGAMNEPWNTIRGFTVLEVSALG